MKKITIALVSVLGIAAPGSATDGQPRYIIGVTDNAAVRRPPAKT